MPETIIEPTREHAVKIRDLLKHGLRGGTGKPEPGDMCVEQCVCYALGEPNSDEPTCVGKAVRSFKISLNDSDWSSNAARAKGMARIAIAQLGSNKINQNIFVKELALATIRRIVPIALRAAAGMHGLPAEHKPKLEDHAAKCEAATKLDAAIAASYAASYAARAAIAKDEVLSLMAEIGAEALQKAGSPGCQWLDVID